MNFEFYSSMPIVQLSDDPEEQYYLFENEQLFQVATTGYPGPGPKSSLVNVESNNKKCRYTFVYNPNGEYNEYNHYYNDKYDDYISKNHLGEYYFHLSADSSNVKKNDNKKIRNYYTVDSAKVDSLFANLLNMPDNITKTLYLADMKQDWTAADTTSRFSFAIRIFPVHFGFSNILSENLIRFISILTTFRYEMLDDDGKGALKYRDLIPQGGLKEYLIGNSSVQDSELSSVKVLIPENSIPRRYGNLTVCSASPNDVIIYEIMPTAQNYIYDMKSKVSRSKDYRTIDWDKDIAEEEKAWIDELCRRHGVERSAIFDGDESFDKIVSIQNGHIRYSLLSHGGANLGKFLRIVTHTPE